LALAACLPVPHWRTSRQYDPPIVSGWHSVLDQPESGFAAETFRPSRAYLLKLSTSPHVRL